MGHSSVPPPNAWVLFVLQQSGEGRERNSRRPTNGVTAEVWRNEFSKENSRLRAIMERITKLKIWKRWRKICYTIKWTGTGWKISLEWNSLRKAIREWQAVLCTDWKLPKASNTERFTSIEKSILCGHSIRVCPYLCALQWFSNSGEKFCDPVKLVNDPLRLAFFTVLVGYRVKIPVTNRAIE